jgi:hypothetical protein
MAWYHRASVIMAEVVAWINPLHHSVESMNGVDGQK